MFLLSLEYGELIMALLLILKHEVDSKLEFCNSYESPFEKSRLNFVLGSFFFSKFTSFWKHKNTIKNTEKKELNCLTFGSLECPMLLKEKNPTKFVIIPFSLQSTISLTFPCYCNVVVIHYKWKQETEYFIRHITVHFTPGFALVALPNVNSTFSRGCETPFSSLVCLYISGFTHAHIS